MREGGTDVFAVSAAATTGNMGSESWGCSVVVDDLVLRVFEGIAVFAVGEGTSSSSSSQLKSSSVAIEPRAEVSRHSCKE